MRAHGERETGEINSGRKGLKKLVVKDRRPHHNITQQLRRWVWRAVVSATQTLAPPAPPQLNRSVAKAVGLSTETRRAAKPAETLEALVGD